MTSARRFVASAFTALAVGVATTAMAQPALAGTVTDYGFGGRGFGTELRGGPVGVSSGRTAQAMLGCTRMTGEKRNNTAAAVDTGQGLYTGAINSTTQSYKTKKKFGERSTNRIAEVVIGDRNGVNITIEGLRTTSNASVNRRTGKLAAASTFASTDISANTGQEEIDDLLGGVGAGIGDLLDLIRDNGPIELPGLATIKLGSKNNIVRKNVAIAQASALRVILHGPDTKAGTRDDILAIIGKSRSTVRRGVTAGVFNGGAVPAKAQALGDLVKVGRLIQRPLPCEGTGGKPRTTSAAGGDLFQADALGLGAVEATSWGVQRANRSAKAWTRSRVAGLDLGGALRVNGIVGRALVTTNRQGKVTARSIKGSTIGSLVINGEAHAIPDPGQAIEVPGVAKLQFFVKDRSKRGIKVTALRVSLLDGTGAVVDLGTARTAIKRH